MTVGYRTLLVSATDLSCGPNILCFHQGQGMRTLFSYYIDLGDSVSQFPVETVCVFINYFLYGLLIY